MDCCKVKCLECGKFFHSVGDHVKHHGLTAREYKIKHCLPVKKSLASEILKDKRSKKAKKYGLQDYGKNIQENVKGMDKSKYGYHVSPYKKMKLQEAVKKSRSKLKRQWVDSDFIEFEKRMKTRSVSSITKDKDMPAYPTYKRWKEKQNDNI